MEGKSSDKTGKPKRSKDDFYRIEVSKTMSYILRHAAKEHNIEMDSMGFVSLDDLIKSAPMKKVKASYESVMHAVNENNKSRFEIVEVDGLKKIRAVQGHTIKEVKAEDALELVENIYEYPTIIHGTYNDAWQFIKNTGLNRMSRNEIHFAIGEKGDKKVVSGMRGSCQVYIELDGPLCTANGIKMYVSKNKVLLSPGVEGIIEPKYFKKVTASDGSVLMTCDYENIIFPYFQIDKENPSNFSLTDITSLNLKSGAVNYSKFAEVDINGKFVPIDLNEFSKAYIQSELNKVSTVLVILKSQITAFSKYLESFNSKLTHPAFFADYIPINCEDQESDYLTRIKVIGEAITTNHLANSANTHKL